MSNSFDNKIKESLEKFEMPYDANAWAEFEKQLPQSGGANSSSSQLGLKIAAFFAVVATTALTIWFVNMNDGKVNLESQNIEQIGEPEIVSSVEETEMISAPIVSSSEEQTTPVANNSKGATTNETATVESAIEQESSAEATATPIANSQAQASNTEPQKKNQNVEEKEEVATITEEKFDVRFIASSKSVCVGEEVSFINESSNKQLSMNWDFGDGSSSEEINASHAYVVPGNYTVQLTGLKGEKTAQQSIDITVKPVPTATLTPTKKLEGYRTIPLYSFSTPLAPSETAVWKFTDGSVAQGENAEHLFRDAGKVGVELTVRNAVGCATTQSWSFDNKKFDLLPYTGFSPDGDLTNETFMPKALPLMGVDFVMIIRNQTGQIVYETSNPTEPWNGRLNNTGSVLDPGIYIWTVVLKEDILRKKDFNGTITIKR